MKAFSKARVMANVAFYATIASVGTLGFLVTGNGFEKSLCAGLLLFSPGLKNFIMWEYHDG